MTGRKRGSKNKQPRPDKGGTSCRIDQEVFLDTIAELIHGRTNPKEAAKRCGISEPTWRKWANKFLLGEDIPETLFKKADEDTNGKQGTD